MQPTRPGLSCARVSGVAVGVFRSKASLHTRARRARHARFRHGRTQVRTMTNVIVAGESEGEGAYEGEGERERASLRYHRSGLTRRRARSDLVRAVDEESGAALAFLCTPFNCIARENDEITANRHRRVSGESIRWSHAASAIAFVNICARRPRRCRHHRRRFPSSFLTTVPLFFPPLRPGLSAWEPMNGARPCVTSLAALVHERGNGLPRVGGAEVSEWVAAGRTVRRWVPCGGYMTQHIDLSLVGRVRGGGKGKRRKR